MTYSNDTPSARAGLLSSLKNGDTLGTIQAARALLQDHSRTREWNFIRNELQKTPRGPLDLKPLKIALLSSFSTEFFHAPLIAYGLVNGLQIQIYQAGFSQFHQEILNSHSELYAFAPDVVILAVEGSDWIPELYTDYTSVMDGGLDAAIDHVRREIDELLDALRGGTSAAVLIHNFSLPLYPEFGVLDLQFQEGQTSSVLKLNEWLAKKCRALPRTYVVDYLGIVSRFGALHWYDDRLNHIARAPIAMEMLQHLVSDYMRFLRAFTGQSKKCLVLDLDGTLWGGVLGEAGIQGIQLGPTYPGSMFMAFQRTILRLQKRGILLAIASKNNPEDVDRVFAAHPDMVLKREHFTCIEVHWKPKSASVAAIARRLNVSLEHIVFVDDTPAECEEVSLALPMVHTICLPHQAEKFSHALLEHGLFDTLSFSDEDRRRTELYNSRDQSEALRTQAGSLEAFYRSLQMNVVFSPLKPSTVRRAAQLTQKTNQFNATTRRYTEAELAEKMRDPNWNVTTVVVSDRFGDNGIVGVMITHSDQGVLDIDTFLLSCRVIGRSIESAMLAHLCKFAGSSGLCEVKGHIFPTAKNLPVRQLFAEHGFYEVSNGNLGEGSTWMLKLSQDSVREPDWMAVVVDAQT